MSSMLTPNWLKTRLTHPDYAPLNFPDDVRLTGWEPADLDTYRGDHNLNQGMYPKVDERGLRVAGVLVPVVVRDEGLSVLFTRRTAHLQHHPGQVSFPGGRAEPEDENLTHTALREAQEEVGLQPDQVEIVGFLDDYLTRSGFVVTPVVGMIEPPFELSLCEDEVADVFEVPLSHLLDASNYQTSSHLFEGYQRKFYALTYEDYYIWGATAGMLVNLHQLLAED